MHSFSLILYSCPIELKMVKICDLWFKQRHRNRNSTKRSFRCLCPLLDVLYYFMPGVVWSTYSALALVAKFNTVCTVNLYPLLLQQLLITNPFKLLIFPPAVSDNCFWNMFSIMASSLWYYEEQMRYKKKYFPLLSSSTPPKLRYSAQLYSVVNFLLSPSSYSANNPSLMQDA